MFFSRVLDLDLPTSRCFVSGLYLLEAHVSHRFAARLTGPSRRSKV